LFVLFYGFGLVKSTFVQQVTPINFDLFYIKMAKFIFEGEFRDFDFVINFRNMKEGQMQ
jgi:hypothetical protein